MAANVIENDVYTFAFYKETANEGGDSIRIFHQRRFR
jgi:hypothetical protein